MKIENEILQLEVYTGGLYREELGIFLVDKEDYFKWFIAAALFGTRIYEACAKKAYSGLIKNGISTPKRVLETNYGDIVKVLDENSYARYDYKTANKLKDIAMHLTTLYSGDMLKLNEGANSFVDLRERLTNLAKGIGNTTVNIYLRELRGILPFADPPISLFAEISAKHLKILGRLKTLRIKDPYLLSKIEAILVRLGKNYCKKNKCIVCPAMDICNFSK